MLRSPAQIFLVAATLLGGAGCALFDRRPPLPRHAAIEHAGKPQGDTDYAALVQSADIIYFPQERAASAGKAEPAALLLEAAQQSGAPCAIAWETVDASQQPILDELSLRPGSARDSVIARLAFSGTGRAREHCRFVLREATAARHLALRPPANLTSGSPALSLDGFTPPAGGWQAFVSRMSGQGSGEKALAAAYRAQLLRQQYAADVIVRYFRGAGSGAKLIVFLSSPDFAPGQGVPYYVAQKLKLRQLVLGSDNPDPARAPLLTRGSGTFRGLQIVDRAPIAFRD